MSFLGAVVLKQSPLNSIEMLWVNIIMDTFASLALSTEPPTDELLKRKPYKKEEPIVTPNMWRNVFG
jgi:magnesium-transporting ATPase (P-type)